MLKKNLWIVVLLAALAIVITGCPEGSLAGSKSLIPIPTYWDDPAFRPGAPKPPPDPISVTFKASGANTTQVAPPPGGNGTVAYVGTDGYSYTYTAGKGHGNGVASFKLDLGDYAIKDFEKVELTLKLVGGDVGDDYTTGPTPQTINLLASDVQFAGWLADDVVIAKTASVRNSVAPSAAGINQNGAEIGEGVTTAQDLEIDLGTTNPVSNLSGEVFFAFYIHAADVGTLGGAGTATKYEISGVTFVPRVGGPTYVPITSLTFGSGDPDDLIGYVGIAKTLDASINPPNATAYGNPIVWTVKTAGAGITTVPPTGIVTATSTGTAVFTATVANGGATAGTPYTQDFTIEFETASDVLVLTVGGVTQNTMVTGIGTTVSYDVTNGYRVKNTAGGYGSSLAFFSVNLGTGKSLKDYMKVTFTYTGVAGDIGFKVLNAYAKTTAFTSSVSEGVLFNVQPSEQMDGTSPFNLSYDIDLGKLSAAFDSAETVYVALHIGANTTATEYTITNVTFVSGNPVTITLNATPGTVSPATVTRHIGSKAGTLPEPSGNSGSYFTGWTDSSNNSVGLSYTITAAATFNAGWVSMPNADLVYSDFDPASNVDNLTFGGYGQSGGTSNAWNISGNYQRLAITLPDKISAAAYPNVVIDVNVDTGATVRVRFMDENGVDVHPSGENGHSIPGPGGLQAAIPTPPWTKTIAIEPTANSGTPIGVTVNSITFKYQ